MSFYKVGGKAIDFVFIPVLAIGFILSVAVGIIGWEFAFWVHSHIDIGWIN